MEKAFTEVERTLEEPDHVQTRLPSGEVTTVQLSKGQEQPSAIDRIWPQGAQGSSQNGERYANALEVGRGAMGAVFRVHDLDLNRSVAMKLIDIKYTGIDDLKRFVTEAQINGQLEHPSVLPVHDFGINAAGKLYFTMKYVAGHRTLNSVLTLLKKGDAETHRIYTFERRVLVVQQVLDALAYAHQRRVIHLDIKPANILIGDNGEVYLADWGIARALQDGNEDLDVQTTTSVDTDEGSVVGTLAYMAPEQAEGRQEDIDEMSDLFSVAAVLYEFATLKHYLGNIEKMSVFEMFELLKKRQRVDAETHFDPINGRVPRQLSRILRKGLAQDSADRWQSALAFRESLQLWIEGKAPIVCPGTFIQSWMGRYSRMIDLRPTLIPAATITVVLFAVAYLVFTVWHFATG